MKRTIIKIDEELCNGCELCVQGCHEGALQMIDGKARLVSELYCDGLGACVGDCPVGAITLEEREAVPYDEIATIQRMIPKGEKTILAHLKHLKEHGEFDYLKQAVSFLKANGVPVDFSSVHNMAVPQHQGGGCPGSREVSFAAPKPVVSGFKMVHPAHSNEPVSQLRQWPVQLHLLNPQAGYFKGADVVLAADCVPFSFPDFHNKFLTGKILAIACPKLDSNKESYVQKIKSMIIDSKINTLQVVIMEVPCCGGLLSLATQAVSESGKKIPVKLSVVGIKGEIIQEEWV
jgi:NAD-dependent dihydropyrimidine dehydrogenase PreA subunit